MSYFTSKQASAVINAYTKRGYLTATERDVLVVDARSALSNIETLRRLLTVITLTIDAEQLTHDEEEYYVVSRDDMLQAHEAGVRVHALWDSNIYSFADAGELDIDSFGEGYDAIYLIDTSAGDV